MRLRDKVREIMPEEVSDEFDGGVIGCPYQYGFLGFEDKGKHMCDRYEDCNECWDQEFTNEPIEPIEPVLPPKPSNEEILRAMETLKAVCANHAHSQICNTCPLFFKDRCLFRATPDSLLINRELTWQAVRDIK